MVVTSETIVYKDVTADSFGGRLTSGTVQQKVKPASADEIGEDTVATAWGEKRGDRLVARVLVYTEPVIRRP